MSQSANCNLRLGVCTLRGNLSIFSGVRIFCSALLFLQETLVNSGNCYSTGRQGSSNLDLLSANVAHYCDQRGLGYVSMVEIFQTLN